MPSDRPSKPHGTFTPATLISRVLGAEHYRWVERSNTAFGGYRCKWDEFRVGGGRVRVTHCPGDEVTDDAARDAESEEMLTVYEQTLTRLGYSVERSGGALYVDPVKKDGS